MQASERVQVPGSERCIDPAHDRVGDVDPTEPIDVTVYLRPTAATDWVDAEAAKPPTERRIVSREEWAAAHGADSAEADAVTAFAKGAGLTVTGAALTGQ